MMITKPIPEHTEAISKICSDGWRQTVQGIYDEEYQAKNVEYWYNHKKVLNDIQNGTYTHVAIIDDQVVGTIGGVLSKEGVSEIYVFYIDETYRYQGIGSKLLDEFTAEHKKNGGDGAVCFPCKKVTIWVYLSICPKGSKKAMRMIDIGGIFKASRKINNNLSFG